MNLVDLSICIVNWNRRDLLRDLLGSLERDGTALTAEIIVVDNDSSDGSPDMLRADFPKVLLFCNRANLGFSKANNQAAAQAQGRLLLFLNNDTIVRPGALDTMGRVLAEHPEVIAVGPRLTDRTGRPRDRYMRLPTLAVLLDRVRLLHWTRLFRPAYRRYRRGAFDAGVSQVVEQMPGSAVMVRRGQFLACGGWDEGFEFGCEDFDLSARLKKLGKLYYSADAEIVHLGGSSSRANLSFVYRNFECGCARYLRKHARSPMASWIYKFCVTFDMPARLGTLAVRYAANRLKGERARAQAAARHLSATADFYFCHLLRFWRC
jgi:N-acetylglucosaminyl-diphospho-decaprenol L-rhamnosyltransferase